MTSVLVKALLEFIVQCRCRFGNAVRANDLAIQVRQWSADDDSNDGQGNEHHAIHPSVKEIWEDVVDVEDESNSTVQDGNASLND